MKNIILSVFLLLSSFSVFADETQKFISTNKTFEYLELSQWIDFVRRIKSDDEIPAHYSIKTPNNYQRSVIELYNLAIYERELRDTIIENLSLVQLDKANKTLANPFVLKIIKNINYNFIPTKKLEMMKGQIHPKLKPLIVSIYNLLAFDSLTKSEHTSFIENYNQTQKAAIVLKNTANIIVEDTLGVKYTLNQFREFALIQLYNRLQKISIPELREFIRIIKNQKEFLKLNQALLAYHFMFIKNIRDDIAQTDKRKNQLGIK